MFDLTGKVAVVTGASSGLGEQMARVFARQGANIAICDIRKEKLDEVAEEIRALGVMCLSIHADLTKDEDLAKVVSDVLDKYGRADILVNNAGGGSNSPSLEMPTDLFEYHLKLNLTACYVLSRDFAKVMIKNGFGRIINIASVHGLVGSYMWSDDPSYKASKGGLVNLTRHLGSQWCQHNVTVNCICPGFFPTEPLKPHLDTPGFMQVVKGIVPAQRMGRMDEIEGPAVFLASEESSYVTGAILTVDGGYTAI